MLGRIKKAYHNGDPRDARQQKHANFWGPSAHQKGTVPIGGKNRTVIKESDLARIAAKHAARRI